MDFYLAVMVLIRIMKRGRKGLRVCVRVYIMFVYPYVRGYNVFYVTIDIYLSLSLLLSTCLSFFNPLFQHLGF